MSHNCENYNNCMRTEMKNLEHPIDKNSLYMNRIYDKQTAARRCYQNNPIRIIEGFNNNVTWDKIIKWIVVILLIVLFVWFAKDLFIPKQTVSIGTNTVSEFQNSIPELLK